MDIGQRLRKLRKDRKLSQETVARALGLDRTTYVKYENGGSIKQNLQELADFFEVSADYLLGREEAMIVRDCRSTFSDKPGCDVVTVLTSFEAEHMEKYRAITSEQRAALDCLLEHYFRADGKTASDAKI